MRVEEKLMLNFLCMCEPGCNIYLVTLVTGAARSPCVSVSESARAAHVNKNGKTFFYSSEFFFGSDDKKNSKGLFSNYSFKLNKL